MVGKNGNVGVPVELLAPPALDVTVLLQSEDGF
jgi:hypothetical protein